MADLQADGSDVTEATVYNPGYAWRQGCAGVYATGVLHDDGTVYVWGTGEEGTLGCGEEIVEVTSPIPMPVPPSLGSVVFVQLVCGAQHMMALSDKSHIFSWGENKHGQLGMATSSQGQAGDKQSQYSPVRVQALDASGVRQIACGARHSLALTDTGDVYSWGYGVWGQLGRGDRSSDDHPRLIQSLRHLDHPVVSVVSRWEHTFALTGNGDLYAWGEGTSGQLGCGIGNQSVPVKITAPGLRGKVASVACGQAHSAAVTRDGSLYMWGKNTDGQLGLGHQETHNGVPTLVESMEQHTVTNVACGSAFTYITTRLKNSTNVQVFACGSNQFGALGVGGSANRNRPTIVTRLNSVGAHRTFCGAYHCIFLTDGGEVLTVGKGSSNQLGHGGGLAGEGEDSTDYTIYDRAATSSSQPSHGEGDTAVIASMDTSRSVAALTSRNGLPVPEDCQQPEAVTGCRPCANTLSLELLHDQPPVLKRHIARLRAQMKDQFDREDGAIAAVRSQAKAAILSTRESTDKAISTLQKDKDGEIERLSDNLKRAMESKMEVEDLLRAAELLPQEKDAQLEEQGQQLSDLQEQLHTMAEDNHQLRDQIRSTRKAMEKSMESKIQEKDAEIAAIGVDNARMVKMAEAEKERMVYQMSLEKDKMARNAANSRAKVAEQYEEELLVLRDSLTAVEAKLARFSFFTLGETIYGRCLCCEELMDAVDLEQHQEQFPNGSCRPE